MDSFDCDIMAGLVGMGGDSPVGVVGSLVASREVGSDGGSSGRRPERDEAECSRVGDARAEPDSGEGACCSRVGDVGVDRVKLLVNLERCF